MPSPDCSIPITVLPSKWIEPLGDEEGRILLSQSIPVGESVTLDGEFKAWIKSPETAVKVGTPFREDDVISIRATMPWLGQTLDHFTFKKDVVIEYPLELGELNILKSLVPSSKNKFTVGVSFRTNICRWRPDRLTGSKIRNKSSTTCGRSTPSRRTVEVTITFLSDRGALLPRGVGWDNLNTKEVAVLAPKSITKSLQFIGVTSGAEINSTAIIRVCLHISLPESGTRGIDEELDASNNLRLIQQSDVMVKISPQYGYNDDASFLLITNPATPTNLIEAMKNIIEDDLKLKFDQWNLGQHGGFEYPPESPEEEPKTVISSYAGKSIMFLGNDFDYFGQGPQNAL
jgi:hypothetical protein